jgi:hypothetical protein
MRLSYTLPFVLLWVSWAIYWRVEARGVKAHVWCESVVCTLCRWWWRGSC